MAFSPSLIDNCVLVRFISRTMMVHGGRNTIIYDTLFVHTRHTENI